jgi:FlgD Ig-like domain
MKRHVLRESDARRPGVRVPGVAGALIVLTALVTFAASPARANYSLGWFSVDGSGSPQSSAGTFALRGTIGQPEAGVLSGGGYSLVGGFWVAASASYTVSVGDGAGESGSLPLSFQLHAAVPNPVSDHTLLSFDLPRQEFVRVRVYDVTGRLARTLAEGEFAAGRHERSWDGADDSGHLVGPGVYFIQLEGRTLRLQQRVVVLR